MSFRPEESRLEALAAYRLLETTSESGADIAEEVAALTRLASLVTGLPLAMVNIIDETTLVQLATVGMDPGAFPREETPCGVHFLDGALVHTSDASQDARFADNAFVDGRLGALRAYASAPLITLDGHALGTLCVADTRPRTLTPTQLAALDDLSRVVLSLFERRREAQVSARHAAEADEQRTLTELLMAEIDERNRLTEAVLSSVGVGIVVSDTAGHIVSSNATATEWLGPIDPDLTLSGQVMEFSVRHRDGVTPMAPEELPLRRALREGPVDGIELVTCAPGRPDRALMCSGRPLVGETGDVTGAVVAFHDITPLREREDLLRAAHEQLGRHAEEAATLARAARTVTAAADPRLAVCEVARELTGADVVLLLQPADDGVLRPTATVGLGDDPVPSFPLPGAGATVGAPGSRGSLAGTAFLGEELLFVADVLSDPRADTELARRCRIRSGAWQPVVMADGRTIGVLVLAWRETVETLPGTTRSMLAALAGEAAHTLERAVLLDRLAQAADHDPLTGLPNRRTWDRATDQEIARAARTGCPLTFMIVDLDHFKNYNDTAGHLAGDELLRAFAAAARDCLREVDVLARWGGEEFAVALPGCSAADAVAIADRIRANVPAAQTATIGVAQWSVGSTAVEVLARADAALYAGKRSGRDRTVVSGAELSLLGGQ
ncbi:diguanylate cyclase domain-containing protein [Kineococcus gynurae]|uniref:Diguanylate cyclase domain-containing protein n=1 Tax=Kineococcus gynurae TaxID=452979 RepID=A0ABV5LPM6_9ACTN